MSNFIGIKSPDGQWLELGNAELSFEIESPVFKFDTIPAEKSFDFNLPITPSNMRYLNYPNRVANIEVFNRRLEGYSLYYGGQLYAVGSLYVLESTTQSIRVSFQTAVARIAKWYDYTLDNFNLGGGYTLPGLHGSLLEGEMLLTTVGNIDSFDYVFAPILNVSYSPSQYINSYNSNLGTFEISSPSNLITPYFYLHFVLKELEYYFGMKHIGNFITDEELRTLVFYSPITCNDVNFSTNRFLPEIKIRDFYKDLAKLFCLSYHFSRTDNTINVKCFKDIYNANEYLDYTSKTNSSSTFEFIEKKGVALIIANDEGDLKVTQSTNSKYFGEIPRTEIETNFSYPTNQDVTSIGPTHYRVPFVEQSFDFPTGEPKPVFKPRLFFYRGHQVNNHGNTYPYLSENEFRYGSVSMPLVNYSLEWDGTKGLYNNFWKQYTEFITTTRIAVFKVQFSLTDILEFDFTKKIRIKSNEYLCKKLKYKVTQHGITECEIELYRL